MLKVELQTFADRGINFFMHFAQASLLHTVLLFVTSQKMGAYKKVD